MQRCYIIDARLAMKAGLCLPHVHSHTSATSRTQEEDGFTWSEMLFSDLPKKLGVLLALIVLSRVGVYIRIPGVDVDAFADTMSNNGVLGYIDALSGGHSER